MPGMGPTGMRACFDWLGAAPLRLRGLYACRQPWYVGMIYTPWIATAACAQCPLTLWHRVYARYVGMMLALVKPFMPKKLKERTHLYGQDTAAMLAAAGLRPEQVPPEFGGTLTDFDPAWFLKGKIETGAAEMLM